MTVASKTPEWLAWQNSLPAILVDVKRIKGNVSDDEKQINANIFAYFCTGSGLTKFPPFNTEISRRFRVVGFSVLENAEKGSAEGEAIFEIEVTKEMSNVYGTLHGGCAAYLLDPTTVAAMVLLGRAKGFDGTGVSLTMNIHWHHPAPLGSTIIVATRTIFMDGRARLARCEMRDKETRKLIVSATHSFLNAGKAVGPRL